VGSSDPAFRGDPDRWNPGDLLVAALSACPSSGISCFGRRRTSALSYEDNAQGAMEEKAGGAGQFAPVLLCPKIVIDAESDPEVASALHHKAHELCFIARSVNFLVEARLGIAVST
jgi:organic hydroperoxide reductase OsmC/OhrA